MSGSRRLSRLSQWGRLIAALTEIALVASLLLAVPALVGARPLSASSSAPTGAYVVPLPPRPTVVRGFDAPTPRWQAGHRGIDLAAPVGASVLAAGDGVVRFAGSVAGKPTVSIEHADGVITTYEPVRASVRQGMRVRRGEVIGAVVGGHDGCAASACLHWGARRGAGRTATYLDPLGLLGAVPVRLKPLGDSAFGGVPP
ncbi:M23 family metallopeptidase [Gordonia sp. NPDC003376]